MIHILKTSKKGIPSISLTPFCDPIPISTDKEIISFPTMLMLLDLLNRSSAYCCYNFQSPDTRIEKEKRIHFLICEACGAKSTIKGKYA